jgi:hypothetical protein
LLALKQIIINMAIFLFNLDPRQKHSFWFGTPFPVLVLVWFYWLTIRQIVPRFMRYRKAYQITEILKLYNIFQIFLCFVLLIKVCCIVVELRDLCQRLSINLHGNFFFVSLLKVNGTLH